YILRKRGSTQRTNAKAYLSRGGVRVEGSKTEKKSNLSFVKSIGISLIIVVFLRAFFFTNYIVEGESMMPTLEDGNLLMVNKIGIKLGELDRFDIVVFHKNKEQDFVKRVICLTSDHIEYPDDVLYVNENSVYEPYLNSIKNELFIDQLTGDITHEEVTGESTVPEDQLFVIGDNRLDS